MRQLSVKDLKALLVIVLGFAIFSLIFSLRGLLYTSIGVGILSLLIPSLGVLIVKGWNKLAELLGWINSRIILGALFFLFLFPISLIYRLFNKDSMNVRSPKKGSMFYDRKHTFVDKDLEQMW